MSEYEETHVPEDDAVVFDRRDDEPAFGPTGDVRYFVDWRNVGGSSA